MDLLYIISEYAESHRNGPMEMDCECNGKMFVRFIELGHFLYKGSMKRNLRKWIHYFHRPQPDCICLEVDLLVYLYKESFLESIDMLKTMSYLNWPPLPYRHYISIPLIIVFMNFDEFTKQLKSTPFMNRSCYYDQRFPESKMNLTYENPDEAISVIQGIYQSHSNPANTANIYFTCKKKQDYEVFVNRILKTVEPIWRYNHDLHIRYHPQ